jgi:uncharacterized membrane protein
MNWQDAAAALFFLAAWRLLAWAIDESPWHARSLSFAMKAHRRAWMREMARRENRIVDASIANGLQQATSFFASTALLAVGAGFALLTAADTIIAAFEESAIHMTVDRSGFYLKTAALMALYAYAFFKFGWAYRLFNYAAVMMAAVPPAGEAGCEAAAASAAEMNIQAAGQFTHGLRAFFLAIAVLAWYVHPWAFVVATVAVGGALLNRQYGSKAKDVALKAMG